MPNPRMRIGFVSMPFAGRLNPITSLVRNLQPRGHDIAFMGVSDVEPFARAANLRFVSFCENEHPVDSVAKLYASISTLHGLEAARQSVHDKNADPFTAASKHLSRK